MNKYKSELRNIQMQYTELISSFDFANADDSFYHKAVTLIEKTEQFWMCNRQKLSIIIDDLSASNNCFVLVGVSFLDVKNNGHYEFAALGDFHFLNDPFVRMRKIFALGKNSVTDYCRKLFLDAYNDTVAILKNYADYFFFISLEVLCSNQFDENIMFGNEVYWNIISDALGKKYLSVDELQRDYQGLDEIERNVNSKVADCFIFSDKNDINLSLKTRVEKYCERGRTMVNIQSQTEVQKFYLSTISLIQTAVNILLNCLQFNLHPFVRYDIIYHYLTLLLYSLPNETEIKNYLLDVIISYFFSTRVIGTETYKIPFVDFYDECQQGKLTAKLYDKLNKIDLSVSKLNANEIIDELSSTYHSVLKKE